METAKSRMKEIHEQLTESLGTMAVAPLTDANSQPINVPTSHPYCVCVYMPHETVIEVNSVVAVIGLESPGLPSFLIAEQSHLPFVRFRYVREESVLLVNSQLPAEDCCLETIIDRVFLIAHVANETGRLISTNWGIVEQEAA